jgi:hypothetical protein
MKSTRRAALCLFGCSAFPFAAHAADPLDGTWGGVDVKHRTAQVIIVGRTIIGVFWGNDYGDATNVRFAPDGASATFGIGGASADLRRSGAGATLTIHQAGAATTIPLRKD